MSLIDFLLPLSLTLLLEGAVALVWKLRKRDWLLFALANVLTNPAVVLLHAMFPGPAVTAALELSAVAVEGFCYRRLGHAIRRPWLFSLCANAFSFCLGLAADRFV